MRNRDNPQNSRIQPNSLGFIMAGVAGRAAGSSIGVPLAGESGPAPKDIDGSRSASAEFNGLWIRPSMCPAWCVKWPLCCWSWFFYVSFETQVHGVFHLTLAPPVCCSLKRVWFGLQFALLCGYVNVRYFNDLTVYTSPLCRESELLSCAS